jgi:hypothetical protein
MPHSFAGWIQGPLWPLVALVVSVIYFITSPTSQPLGQRFLLSAHGALTAFLYFGAMTIWWTGHSGDHWLLPLWLVFLASLGSVTASFILFRGKKAVHFLQIPNLLALAWTAFIASMALPGDWL